MMSCRRAEGGHALSSPVKCRYVNEKKSAMFAGWQVIVPNRCSFCCTYHNNLQTETLWIVDQKLRNANFGRFRRQTSIACVLLVLRLDQCRSHRCRTPLCVCSMHIHKRRHDAVNHQVAQSLWRHWPITARAGRLHCLSELLAHSVTTDPILFCRVSFFFF